MKKEAFNDGNVVTGSFVRSFVRCTFYLQLCALYLKRKFQGNTDVTRFGEISPFWHYFKSFWQLCETLFGVGQKYLNLLWSTFCAVGQIFIVGNGLIFTNNLPI